MKQIVVEGGKTLSGTITISGAKNSAVALLPAALMTKGIVTIHNVPNISDIMAIKEILTYLGAEVSSVGHSITIDGKNIQNKVIPEEFAKKLRASYYFMGAMLGRFHECDMAFPGGCPIGARPINLHLEGFEALGCEITARDNQYLAKAMKLIGTDLYVKHSVGATINLLFASILAEGTTVIHEAAKEPEIGHVVELLVNMGANIEGIHTDTLTIHGVTELHGGETNVIPDRIEAGTYMIAGALCGESLKIEALNPNHLTALLDVMQEMQVNIEVESNCVIITHSHNLLPVNIKTEVYPGFATDLQQPITPLLTVANGLSSIEETIYENRFKHVAYLNNMGADIEVKNRMLAIIGPKKLHGCEVVATDLRAGASLVLASLIADGTTIINDVEHILRGYEGIVEKLTAVGAKIEIREI